MPLCLIFHISDFHNSKIVNNIFFFIFEGGLIFLPWGVYNFHSMNKYATSPVLFSSPLLKSILKILFQRKFSKVKTSWEQSKNEWYARNIPICHFCSPYIHKWRERERESIGGILSIEKFRTHMIDITLGKKL